MELLETNNRPREMFVTKHGVPIVFHLTRNDISCNRFCLPVYFSLTFYRVFADNFLIIRNHVEARGRPS